MTTAAARIRARWPAARFLLAQAPTLDGAFVEQAVAVDPGSGSFEERRTV